MGGIVRLTGAQIDTLAIVRTSIATEVSITATTSATGNTCLTLGPADYPGGSYKFEIYVPYLTLGTTNLDVELFEGTTFLTSLSGHMAAALARPGATFQAIQSITPGNHTYKVTAFVDAGTGKFGANNGATGNAPNALGFVYPA